MRITTQAKEETRQRIRAVAEQLFAEQGFAATSTRDLAAAAGIAAGTLFNYYPGKEALAVSILSSALDRGRQAFVASQRGDEPLEESLFAHIACALRELQPYRNYAGEVLESALSPFQRSSGLDTHGDLRGAHIATADALLRAHDPKGAAPSPVTLHLYWTLYLGVLAYWSRDPSPHQEDTLAVLDESMRLFVSSLPHSSTNERERTRPQEDRRES